MPETNCNILGTLTDSEATPLEGKLTVVLTAPRTVESTTPDTYQSTVLKEFVISLGSIDITLRETESVEIPYRFRFYLSNGSGGYETNPIFDFNAIVPDVASVQFGSLVPTGITVDRISTGALRVAKLIMTDPALQNEVIESIGLFRSATQPTATGDGDVWIKSDDASIWTWNASLSKWLSEPFVITCGVTGMTVETEVLKEIPNFLGKTQAYIARVDLKAKVNAPNSGSNYWRFQSGYQLQGNSSLDTIGIMNSTQASAAVTLVHRTITPNTLLTIQGGATPVEYLGLQLLPVGSPGTVNASAAFMLRYVW